MASYRLVFKKSVSKDLQRLPGKDLARVLQRIEALAEDPRPEGCEKLTAQEKYRVRQGSYRIIYEIVEQQLVVTVVKVGHRRDIYRR